MDPISLAIGAVGLGMQIFGGAKSASDSSAYASSANAIAAQQTANAQDQAKQEQSISDQKQQAMQLEGRRQQMENVRTNQRARAQATNAAVSQGAQFGSGLQGGLAQINDQTAFNMSGVNSALQTGTNIANYNANISADRFTEAGLQGQQNTLKNNYQAQSATDQGISSLGGALMKSGPIIGQLGQNAFGGVKSMNLGQGLFGGGSPSGY